MRITTMHGGFGRLACCALTLAAIGACASRTTESVSAGTVSPSSAMGTTGTFSTDGLMGRTDIQESPGAMFADGKIAAIASASNMDEIQTSQLAVQRVRNAQLRQFAQMMIDEHTRLEQQQQTMLSQKGMQPMDNALSLQKKRNLQAMLQRLRGLSDEEFEREYTLHQIGSHMMTLHTLNTTLIPEAEDPLMKAMLQNQVRPAVEQHLQQLKQIHLALMAQPGMHGHQQNTPGQPSTQQQQNQQGQNPPGTQGKSGTSGAQGTSGSTGTSGTTGGTTGTTGTSGTSGPPRPPSNR